MTRRSSGLIGLWVATQQQRQREQEAQYRHQIAQQREREQLHRQAQRAAARDERAALAAYQQARLAEAQARTAELERQVTIACDVLRSVTCTPAFTADRLRDRAPIPPFSPGRAAVPVPMPDPRRYQVSAPTAWQSLAPGARRQYDEQVAHARARFEQDCRAARAAEQQRQRWLAEHHQRYQAWVARRHREQAERDAAVEDLVRRLVQRQDQAVQEYFTAALYATPWPDGFTRRARVAWDAAARQLVVDWQLPPLDVVPAVARARYFKVRDETTEMARPVAERRALYRDVLAQCALRVLAELYRADVHHVLDSVALNGMVDIVDPATGIPALRYLVTVMAHRAEFEVISLDQVEAVTCLEHLRGQLSARPDQLLAVRPARLPEQVGGQIVDQHTDEAPDLFQMDPIEFEQLIAALFQARGFAVLTTERSGDGGVDVIAEDPDPITGGEIIVQVKRYRNTVSPNAVRDLYGVVTHRGATKGILITTSGFGPGAHEFAQHKPLTLISGPELVDLLTRHGLSGYLGPAST
ncbi:MAG: restriction endonuclease [Micromonosporaceae bacterium]|nr:restriction endonuclease [Micromonosporaceae bacterium]